MNLVLHVNVPGIWMQLCTEMHCYWALYVCVKCMPLGALARTVLLITPAAMAHVRFIANACLTIVGACYVAGAHRGVCARQVPRREQRHQEQAVDGCGGEGPGGAGVQVYQHHAGRSRHGQDLVGGGTSLWLRVVLALPWGI